MLTPRLSSYWVHLVTPVPAVIARPLNWYLWYPIHAVIFSGLSRRIAARAEKLDFL